MKSKFLIICVFLLGGLLFFSSCIKNEITPLGDTGTPRIKIREAPENIQYFSPFSGTKVVDLVTIRRDEVSEAGVNKTITVKVTNNLDSLDSYNYDYDTEYEPFPDSVATLVTTNGVSQSGNDYVVTFAPGVTAVTISMIINGDKWDPSYSYANYLVLTDGGGDQINPLANEALTAIAIKNQWDGNYKVTGSMVDFASSSLSGPYPWNVTLLTSGLYSFQVRDNDYTGGIYHKILSGTSNSYYGSFGIQINMNPDNTVNSVINVYGQPAGNGRSAELDPSGLNYYDPSTKTLYIKYWMNQTGISGLPDPPHRTSFDEVYTFTSPR